MRILTTMEAVAQIVDESPVESLVERLHEQEQQTLERVDDQTRREVTDREAHVDE